MNRAQALDEVDEIGGAYFYDEDAPTEEIIAEIQGQIQSARSLSGLEGWKVRRDALQTVLAECSEAELDRMMRLFGLPLQRVGGRGRNFLEHLHQVIAEGIREKTSQLSGS